MERDAEGAGVVTGDDDGRLVRISPEPAAVPALKILDELVAVVYEARRALPAARLHFARDCARAAHVVLRIVMVETRNALVLRDKNLRQI